MWVQKIANFDVDKTSLKTQFPEMYSKSLMCIKNKMYHTTPKTTKAFVLK